MAGQWVFGYGSLVSPVSFGFTLGRDLTPGVDFLEAELVGYGRRWNYGTGFTFTTVAEDGEGDVEWTFVALGLIRAIDETTNGVVGWVDDAELAALDLRERQYDRVDVTTLASVSDDATDAVRDAPIVTYIPRSEAVRIYEVAKARGTAAITTRYWDLVDGAFAALGPDRRARYHATTPDPGIPIVEVPPEQLPERHRTNVR